MDAGAASRAFFRSSPTLPCSAPRHRLALAGGQPRTHLRLRHRRRLPQQLRRRPLPLPADPEPPHRCRPSRRHHLRGWARRRRRRGVQQLSPRRRLPGRRRRVGGRVLLHAHVGLARGRRHLRAGDRGRRLERRCGWPVPRREDGIPRRDDPTSAHTRRSTVSLAYGGDNIDMGLRHRGCRHGAATTTTTSGLQQQRRHRHRLLS